MKKKKNLIITSATIIILTISCMGMVAAAKQNGLQNDDELLLYDGQFYNIEEQSFDNHVILRVMENGDDYKLTTVCLTDKQIYYVNLSPDTEIIGENGDILTASKLTPRQHIGFTGNKSVLCIAPAGVKCKSMNVLGTDPAAYDEAKAIYMKSIELPLKCGANIFIPE